jgi:hypothetical protein
MGLTAPVGPEPFTGPPPAALDMTSFAFRAPGPICNAFFVDRSPVSCIMGPVGSGKTSASLLKAVWVAAEQTPSPIDGRRRCKFAVIRDTYPALEKTTLSTWFNWIPRAVGQYRAEPPPTHWLVFDLGKAGLVDLMVEFIALGEHRVEDVMRGWEGTCAYLNEADRLPEDVLTFVRSRVGRYPPRFHGGATRGLVWCDMNAPDAENWTYRVFVEDRRDGFKFFRQPSGLDARAENVKQLPDGYYDALLSNADWWTRRFIKNEFGYSRDGKPVFTEFNDARHMAEHDLAPIPGAPLTIGADAGLTPAAVILQRDSFGQWRALDELVGADMGSIRFAQALARLLAERYRGLAVRAFCDPTADSRSATDEGTWIEGVHGEAGIRFRPAPTNALQPRLEAVRGVLARTIDGTRPGLVISPRCKVLRKGMNSGYRYRRFLLAGENRYDEKPDKNEFSHAMDALQYGLLGGGEFFEVRKRQQQQRQHARPVMARHDFDPLGRAP